MTGEHSQWLLQPLQRAPARAHPAIEATSARGARREQPIFGVRSPAESQNSQNWRRSLDDQGNRILFGVRGEEAAPEPRLSHHRASVPPQDIFFKLSGGRAMAAIATVGTVARVSRPPCSCSCIARSFEGTVSEIRLSHERHRTTRAQANQGPPVTLRRCGQILRNGRALSGLSSASPIRLCFGTKKCAEAVSRE